MSLHPDDPNQLDPACAYVRDNADAFALNSLSDSEARNLIAHVNEHPECAQFLREAMATVEALAFSMPLVAAPDLAVKMKLFDRISAKTEATSSPRSRVQTSNEIVAAFSGSTQRVPIAEAPEPRRNWVQYLSAAVVAPLAIALVVMSLWAFNMNEELDSMRDASATSETGSGTSIEMLTMESSDKSSTARGSLGAMPDQKSAVLLAWDLDPGQEHEVWCEESDGQKTMVSALDVGEDGNAMQTIKFPGPIDGYKRIFVAGSEDDDSDAPELILTIPEKVGKDENVEPAATP
jgi:hypothetical protein